MLKDMIIIAALLILSWSNLQQRKEIDNLSTQLMVNSASIKLIQNTVPTDSNLSVENRDMIWDIINTVGEIQQHR